MNVSVRGAPLLESRSPVVTVDGQQVRVTSPSGQNLVDSGANAISVLARASTGSGTFVYRVRTIDKEYVVFKVAIERKAVGERLAGMRRVKTSKGIVYRRATASRTTLRDKKILAGLKHEKQAYEMFTRLVVGEVTPFLMMGVLLPKNGRAPLPPNVIATETAAPQDIISLSDYLRRQRLSYRNARALIFQLVYTVEVLYRVGARHNDVHLGNVMMVRQRGAVGKVMRVVYVTRTDGLAGGRREFEYDLPLNEWQPRLYDFDRVFKRNWSPRMDNVRNTFTERGSGIVLKPSAVTNRFPWHNPKFNTADFDVMKVLQHIRKAASAHANGNLLDAIGDISLSRSQLHGFVRRYNLSMQTWFTYYIPVHRMRDVEQNISSELRSPEMVILTNLGPQFPKNVSNTPVLIANMRNLYRS